MEEFPKTTPLEQPDKSSKEKEEKRKKGPRGFLESYLRAFYPDKIKDTKEDSENLEKQDKKSRWEKWTEPLRAPWERLFKDKVEIEPATDGSKPETGPENSLAETNQPEKALADSQASNATTTTELEAHTFNQTEKPASDPQEVTAKIEHDAEPIESSSESYVPNNAEQLPEVISATYQAQEQDQENIAAPPESVLAIPETESGASNLPFAQESKISEGEVNREREEKRLKREVRRLEETAKDIRDEKDDIKRQQDKFSHELEKQYKAYEKLHKETLPKLTRSRERLRTRLEPASAVKAPELHRPPRETFKVPEAPVSHTRPSNERLMELANVTPVVAPEAVQHTVEHAAEQNIAIESAYERRHELKDDPIAFGSVSAGAQGTIASISYQQASGASIDLREITKSASHAADQLKDQHSQIAAMPPPTKDLYAQAVKNGFWAAIVLLIFLGLIMLTR